MKPKRAVYASPPASLFWPSWIASAVVVFLVDLLDVQAILHGDAHRRFSPWEPVVWEYSSGVVLVALFPLIWRAAHWAHPRDGRPLRFLLVHVLTSLGFCLAHVGGILLLRDVIYALAGLRYHFGDFTAVLYEYSRDVIVYGLALAGIWSVSALTNGLRASAALPMASTPGAPATFDIRDGARTLRVPLGDIAAVSSAGNYVEFSLVDCRKPLMRGTLGAMESQLVSKGFVRIHRSWLVNAARVEAIEPAGSGDFTVTLAGGVKAPLSRRFREALEALRG